MKINPLIPGSQYIKHNDWHIYHSPRLGIVWLCDLLSRKVPLNKKESEEVVKTNETSVLLKLDSDIGLVAARHFQKPVLKNIVKNTLGPDPAQVSWYFSHHLNTNGINNPAPLAFMEERKMGIPLRSWYLCQFEEGIDCENYFLHAKAITPAMANIAAAIVDMFISIRECQLSHGNLKADKLLIINGRPCLIDLSHMKFHPDEKIALEMWQSDVEIFMNSWDEKYDAFKHFKQAFLKRNITF